MYLIEEEDEIDKKSTTPFPFLKKSTVALPLRACMTTGKHSRFWNPL
jgi:hypothetical protein